MDVYISNWKETQRLSTKARVYVIRHSPGTVTASSLALSSIRVCQLRRVGEEMGVQVSACGPVPRATSLEAESGRQTTLPLGI